MTASKQQTVAALLDRHGRTFAEEPRIDEDDYDGVRAAAKDG